MNNKLIKYNIIYPNMFEMLPGAPTAVKITEKDENELTKKLGYHWYFISKNLIKYYDEKEKNGSVSLLCQQK
ncbi:MAG: hypothetical protein QW469_00315 [Candidatus Aenigmatarchaeota archaeon]